MLQKLKPWAIHLLKLGFSVGVILYLVSVTDLHSLKDGLRSANSWGIAAATLLTLVGVIWLQALEIWFSMSPANRVSVWALCKINLALMFYVLFLPAGITFIIRWEKYRRAGYGGYDSAALVGFHKFLQLAVACVFCAASVILLREQIGRFGTELMLLSCAALVVLVVAPVAVWRGWTGALWTLFPSLQSGASRPPQEGRSRLALLGEKLGKVLSKLIVAFSAFGKLSRRDLYLVGLFALLQHVFIIMSAWVVMELVVPDAAVLPMVLVRSVVVILLMVPVSVGGLGVRELAFFTLFPLFGISSADALSASLLMFLVQLIVSAMGGLVELGEWMTPKTRSHEPGTQET